MSIAHADLISLGLVQPRYNQEQKSSCRQYRRYLHDALPGNLMIDPDGVCSLEDVEGSTICYLRDINHVKDLLEVLTRWKPEGK